MPNPLVSFDHVTRGACRVEFNGVTIGSLVLDADGEWRFWPRDTNRAWPAWIMRSIADKLDRLTAEMYKPRTSPA